MNEQLYMMGLGVSLTEKVDKAIARLIAAAPALLEGLQGLFEHCAMIHTCWGAKSNAKKAAAAGAAALAAIAKAIVEKPIA
jgi:hypothetical protein